jgi:ubiquinone biosynthesis protein UbiJ
LPYHSAMTESSAQHRASGAFASLNAFLGDFAGQAQRRALAIVLAAFEHLLRQQQWARDRLRAHAGATLRLGLDAPPLAQLPPPEWRVTIDEQGFLRPAEADASPSVSLLLRPSVDAVFAMLRDGPDGISRHLKVDGDVALAATMGELARHLRWEPEEDLSRVVGDAAAHRIVRAAGDRVDRFRDIGRRASSGASQFMTGDQQQLATRPLVHWLRDGAAALDERVSALEARLERLRRTP